MVLHSTARQPLSVRPFCFIAAVLASHFLGCFAPPGLLAQERCALTPKLDDSAATTRMVRAAFEENKLLKTVSGELVATDQRYGHLVIDDEGQLTAIAPSDLKRIEDIPGPLAPKSAKELAAKVLSLMPVGSRSIATDHFVVCYNTSDVYARWNSNLYERLYNGMFRFWKEKGVELTEPRFPLVALVFETKDDYVRYANREFEGADNTIGYYHQSTNRLASYDLTGIEGMLPPGTHVMRDELIQQILKRPQAERTVATIVHEACHQISFNCGLQVRLGDNPLWLSEGLATFFESPDGSSASGWGGTGKVNKHNLVNLAKYVPTRPADSLTRLLMEDQRLRSPETSTSAYAEAWGLTYYLLKSKPKPFVAYLDRIREKAPGQQSSPKERLELFQQCFGEDMVKFDRDFIRFMQKVRP